MTLGAGFLKEGATTGGIAAGWESGEPFLNGLAAVGVFLVAEETAGPACDVGGGTAQETPTLFEIEIEFAWSELAGFEGGDEGFVERATFEEELENCGTESGTEGFPAGDQLGAGIRVASGAEDLKGGGLDLRRFETVHEPQESGRGVGILGQERDGSGAVRDRQGDVGGGGMGGGEPLEACRGDGGSPGGIEMPEGGQFVVIGDRFEGFPMLPDG